MRLTQAGIVSPLFWNNHSLSAVIVIRRQDAFLHKHLTNCFCFHSTKSLCNSNESCS